MVSKIKYMLIVICFVILMPLITSCTRSDRVEKTIEKEIEIDKSKQDAEAIIQKYLEDKYKGITVYSVYRPCSSGLAPMTNEDGSWDYEALTDDFLSGDGDTDVFNCTVYRDENRCVTKVLVHYKSKTMDISDEFEP